MKKFILISLVTVSLLQANWVDSAVDNVYSSGPTAWESSTHMGYNSGSFHYRPGRIDAITPDISFRAPSVSAGCGGIDALSASFSFLSPEALVSKLKNITAIAPAFAFKLALQTLCKDCDNAMTEIQKFVDNLNKISLDSCNSLDKAVDWASNQYGDAISESIGLGKVDSWIGKKIESITIDDEIAEMFSNDSQFLENYAWGSLVVHTFEHDQKSDKSVLNKIKIFDSEEKNIQFVRSLVGDIYGYWKKGDGSTDEAENKADGSYQIAVFQPKAIVGDVVDALLHATQDNPMVLPIMEIDITGAEVTKDKVTFPQGSGPKAAEQEGTIKDGIVDKIQNALLSVQQDLIDGKTVDDEKLQMIGSLDKGIIQLLKTDDAFDNANLEVITRYAAAQLVEGYLQDLLRAFNISMNRYMLNEKIGKATDTTKIEELRLKMLDNIKYINTQIEKETEKIKQDFVIYVEKRKNFMQYKKDLQNMANQYTLY